MSQYNEYNPSDQEVNKTLLVYANESYGLTDIKLVALSKTAYIHLHAAHIEKGANLHYMYTSCTKHSLRQSI